jgi:hypothetical protein
MQSSRRNNSRRNPLDQFFGHFLPPVGLGSGSGSGLDATTLRQAMTTLEDSIYQYNRNIREYNENIRQMDHHLYILTQQLRRRPHDHSPAATAAAFTFSFEPTEATVPRARVPDPPLTNDELIPLLRMFRYDQERMPTLTHCPITLDLFRQGEDVCEIRGCSHIFKRDPILQWLHRSPVCPVCRYDLRTPTPSDETTIPTVAAATSAAATSSAATSATAPTSADSVPTNFFRDMFQHLTSSSTSRDVSGGLMYEFEMPLEMLTQTLQQHFRNTEEEEEDLVHHVD